VRSRATSPEFIFASHAAFSDASLFFFLPLFSLLGLSLTFCSPFLSWDIAAVRYASPPQLFPPRPSPKLLGYRPRQSYSAKQPSNKKRRFFHLFSRHAASLTRLFISLFVFAYAHVETIITPKRSSSSQRSCFRLSEGTSCRSQFSMCL